MGRSPGHSIEHRWGVRLEGTFRNPPMVAQTAQRCGEAGRQVEAVGPASPARTSLLSTVVRFLEAPRPPPAGRPHRTTI
ncbi:zeta toxin family protein [Nocardiopsis sp. MG754419]|uniref:zeta toxin family protein n=1 Tax=Nocardiopsis sp. MG754419 TaxID=2259865 RepID=UPI001BAB6F04|nr:hypothetical protein [Nocardiopsis sp. MG754419]